MKRPHRLAFQKPGEAARAGALLREAGYDDDGVLGLLRAEDLLDAQSEGLTLLLRRTRRGTRLDTLVRLFVIGSEVPLADAEAAVAPMDVADWVAAGLLRAEGDSAQALVELHPYRGVVLAVDRRWKPGRLPGDFVMPVAGSSRKLANATVRRSVARTLDLGTGSGVQALLAARHSGSVRGVDANARALEFARFGAQLNELSNVEFAEEDFLAPQGTEPFDLILANPPFVLSPETRYTFRDSGHSGDELLRKILRAAAGRLAEGGFAQIVGNWLMLGGEDPEVRLRPWFQHTGCDVWVLAGDPVAPAEYAANWIRQTEKSSSPSFERQLAAWIAYFERLGVVAIGHGVITLRRVTGRASWLRMTDEPPEAGPTGDAIDLGFRLQDFLNETSDPQVLDHRFRVSPHLRVRRDLAPGPSGFELTESRVRLVKGLAYEGAINDDVLALLNRCRGDRTLRHIAQEIATGSGKGLAEISASCVTLVRQLLQPGFLLPEEETLS